VGGAVLQGEKPEEFHKFGGPGYDGFGLPAAIGAKIANPSRTVIDISGDGSFQMNSQELCHGGCQ